MRRLIVVLTSSTLMLGLALAPSACKRKKRQPAAAEEPLVGLATVVHTADPRTGPQLVRGFHPIEQNAWRWTTGNFAVVLKPPAGAAQKGATLQFKFAIPEVVLSRLGTIQLSAKVNGHDLDPETYSRPGEQVYSRDVPPSAIPGDTATVEFKLDKSLPPSGQDVRELGVVASMIGFEAKP